MITNMSLTEQHDDDFFGECVQRGCVLALRLERTFGRFPFDFQPECGFCPAAYMCAHSSRRASVVEGWLGQEDALLCRRLSRMTSWPPRSAQPTDSLR